MAGGGANMGGVSSTGYGTSSGTSPFGSTPMAGGDDFVPTSQSQAQVGQAMGGLFGLGSVGTNAQQPTQGAGPTAPIDQQRLGEISSWLRGTPAEAAPQTDQINDLYKNVLGREADQGGHDFWTNSLLSGNSIDSIKQQMMTSPEYQRNQIGGMYQDLLGRTADQGGLDFWANAAQQGTSLDAIRNQIMTSPEYMKAHPAAITATPATTAATPVAAETPTAAAPAYTPTTTTWSAPTPQQQTFAGPTAITQSGGIGSGGAMNYQYRRGGILNIR